MNLANTNTIVEKPPSVFKNLNFNLLFTGKTISILWDQIYTFALSWYILDLTKSSFEMSLFFVINCAISALISPFGGIIADRVNRKGILVWMDIIRGFVVIVAALLLAANMIQIWMLYLSAVILAFCGAIFTPTASAIIPNIVEERQLVQASSLDQSLWSFCSMIGLFVSGFLYHWIGIFAIFMLYAIAYFISGILEACLNLPRKIQNHLTSHPGIFQALGREFNELAEGYRYVINNKLVFYLVMLNALFHLVVFPMIMVFFPYIFNVLLMASSVQLSITQSAGWLGVILGAMLVSVFLKRIQLRKALFWGLLTYSICTFIMFPIFSPQIQQYFSNWGITVLFSALGIIIGIAVTFFDIPINVIYQKYTADEYRGRFWGFQGSVMTMAMAVGYFLGGILAQRVWMGFLFLGIALMTLAINLWVTHLREVKELKE
jgi:MFS family permease